MIWVVFGIAFMCALLLPGDALDGTVGTMIITFFGLLAAGFVPAITLIVSTSFAGKYTVKEIKSLKTEIFHLNNLLVSTVSFIISGGVFSIIMVAVPDIKIEYNFSDISINLIDIFHRIIQAIVISCFVVSLDRMRLVKVAFHKVLSERYKMAEREAKSMIDNNISSSGDVRNSFRRSEDFGKVLKMGAPE